MDTRLEALAGFVLSELAEGNLSDAVVFEFAEQVCICMREDMGIPWGDQMEKLWDYLAGGSGAFDGGIRNADSIFQQGRIYAAMELLKMFRQRQEDECTLEEDAKEYSVHWRMVFLALYNGKSMTHRELAKAADLSDSSLSQFLHKIEKKNYILSRKAGRTKYYWLSSKGRELVECMPVRKRGGFSLGLPMSGSKAELEFLLDAMMPVYRSPLVQDKMYFKGSVYADSIKSMSEIKEDMYICV